jgi:hypothetical protein
MVVNIINSPPAVVLSPGVPPAVAVSAVAFLVTAFTLVKLAGRPASRAYATRNEEVAPLSEPNPNITFLRNACIVLLVFCCFGSLVLVIGTVVGFTTVGDIWEFMKIAVLAEALALGYYRVIRKS